MDPVFALSISGPLTDIGAVAGLVAIPGLAVLSLLYFAQAREVKRRSGNVEEMPRRCHQQQRGGSVFQIHPLEVSLSMEHGERAPSSEGRASSMPDDGLSDVTAAIAEEADAIGQVDVLV